MSPTYVTRPLWGRTSARNIPCRSESERNDVRILGTSVRAVGLRPTQHTLRSKDATSHRPPQAERRNTHGHPHRAAAGPRAILLSKHCCVWTRRASWKRHPSPASTRKYMPSPSRARTPLRLHFELILPSEIVPRIQHVCSRSASCLRPAIGRAS